MPHSSENSVDLPAPFGPMMQRSSARRHVEADVVGRDHAAEPLGQPLGGEGGACRHPQRPVNAAAIVARQPWRGRSRASVTMMPRGKNIITTTSSTPMITIAYWLPAEDSE